MEHQKAAGKSMNKILNFLPRASSSVTHKSHLGIGSSGPMISIVPSETHRKIKNDTVVYEPTSPRVSCMGQVKCKHYRKLTDAGSNVNTDKPTNKFSRSTTSYTVARTYRNEEEKEKSKKVDTVVVNNKNKSGILRLFGGSRRKTDATDTSKTALTVPKGPCLKTMNRFSSGREAFVNFDWLTQVAPTDSGQRNYFTDDDEKDGGDGEEVVMPSSVPVMMRNKGVCDNFSNRMGGVKLEARKEINLWKRRTMDQPQPLQLHGSN